MKIERQFANSLNDSNVQKLRNRRDEWGAASNSFEVVYVSTVVIRTPEHVSQAQFMAQSTSHISIYLFIFSLANCKYSSQLWRNQRFCDDIEGYTRRTLFVLQGAQRTLFGVF